jgi:diaminohydroxyphosphoribosylaminopyrimidine deaminase/5-amino-6-(5-phosphoribosylamino)uracil reductase
LLVVTAPDADADRASALRDAGAEIFVAGGDARVDRIASALADLGRREITTLFIEGGQTLASAFLAADQIDESRTFIAPVLLGGANAASRAGGVMAGDAATTGPARLSALDSSVEMVGEDVLVTARYKEW